MKAFREKLCCDLSAMNVFVRRQECPASSATLVPIWLLSLPFWRILDLGRAPSVRTWQGLGVQPCDGRWVQRDPGWPAPKAVLTESHGLRTAHAVCQVQGSFFLIGTRVSAVCLPPGRKSPNFCSWSPPFPALTAGVTMFLDCFLVQMPAFNLLPYSL